MKPKFIIVKCCLFIGFLMLYSNCFCQSKISGEVIEKETGEPIIGATIIIGGTTDGALSDWDGSFEFETNQNFPLNISISYLGYVTQIISMADANERIKVSMDIDAVTIAEVEVVGQRISDKQKQAPLTVESLDALAIKQTASTDFYNGLGALKGVDLTTASIGFTIINTRGFNSTSPVRSLQIIDGVDNQSPGLNFSLGNFLGAPELDIQKVDLVVGASSAFYGPNAFNGVISMETKNPFYNKGLSASFKVGERNLIEGAVRYADAFKNKNGKDWFAFKVNFSGMKALDWAADNEDPVYDTEDGRENYGGYDKVNTYGDEYSVTLDYADYPLFTEYVGLGRFYRTGYKEGDVVDYNSENAKVNAGLVFRLNPKLDEESPEILYGFNACKGTTVYQGDNRFSLRNILFFQNKIELRKRDKYFLRFYNTQEDAGDSYDPYFTSLLLNGRAKDNVNWASDYVRYWQDNVKTEMIEKGYPVLKIEYDPLTGVFNSIFDQIAAENWLANNQDFLKQSHIDARKYADEFISSINNQPYLVPGSPEFLTTFNEIKSKKSNKRADDESGTKFFDQSALYHGQGEYKFSPKFLESWVVGGSFRLYRPNSEGTIFYDTAGVKIKNSEFGFYTGIEKKFMESKFKFNATIRADKNQNFNWLLSPAASLVYTPKENNFFRLSFSSALRNPTLTDQYLFLDVGPAILAGNLNGVNDLIPVQSFRNYINSGFVSDSLEFFNIAGVKPEKVKSMELGYRTTIFKSTYIDASLYYSVYTDFLGYVIGVKSDFDALTGFPKNTQAYRFASNSDNKVSTQGFSIGINHYFWNHYMFNANYSWNKLNKLDEEDPIIPAFNTPENKYNIGISGRDLKMGGVKAFGFNFNYRWVDAFIFEGSPQFTGLIPSYGLFDGQINFGFKSLNSTVKIGASNMLNNKVYQTYGGPRIGRMAYVSLVYDFRKK